MDVCKGNTISIWSYVHYITIEFSLNNLAKLIRFTEKSFKLKDVANSLDSKLLFYHIAISTGNRHDL